MAGVFVVVICREPPVLQPLKQIGFEIDGGPGPC